ncbi:MAG: hypothetical protein FWG73_08920 [Planctomycetaceae bacterium]|nr:hypothetical protein [Planctomycetaceae bacterium]
MTQSLTPRSTTKEKNENTFVGIDVAKEELVLHILSNNEQLTVPNSVVGIKMLVTRRQQLIAMRTQEKNRLQQTAQKTIKKSIEKVIAAFDKQIALLDASIKKMIDANLDWSEKDKIIQSVPGVCSSGIIYGGSECD